MSLPEWVVMGRIGAPYGVRGWFRVQHYTETLDGLASYPVWWVGRSPDYGSYRLLDWRVHGSALVVQLEGIEDRALAEALRGQDIVIPREALPPAAEGEFYQADLIGLEVVNQKGLLLGHVHDMLDTGAPHPVMVVQAETGVQTLIPFVEVFILGVDLGNARVDVVWETED